MTSPAQNSLIKNDPNHPFPLTLFEELERIQKSCPILAQFQDSIIPQGQLVIVTKEKYKVLKLSISKHLKEANQIIKNYKAQLEDNQQKLKFLLRSYDACKLSENAPSPSMDTFLKLLDSLWRQRSAEKKYLQEENRRLLWDLQAFEQREYKWKQMELQFDLLRQEVSMKSNKILSQHRQIETLKQLNNDLVSANTYYMQQSVNRQDSIARQLSNSNLRAEETYFLVKKIQTSLMDLPEAREYTTKDVKDPQNIEELLK